MTDKKGTKVDNALKELGRKDTKANREDVAKGLREWGIDPNAPSKK